jgi:acyl dehydratase
MPPTRWFEDFAVGDTATFGDHEVTEQEIIRFATEYDPQSFHTDPEAARASIFGGLIASGWNTAAIMMRALVDHYVSAESSLGSPGIDELRWTQPVRPGDRLRVRVTVTETIPSRSKPDRGVVRGFTEVLNQRGEVVMTMKGMTMHRARPKA